MATAQTPSWFQAQIDLVRAKVPPPSLPPTPTLQKKPSVADIAGYFRQFKDLDHESQAESLYPEAGSWNRALLLEYAAPVSQFLTMLRSLVNIAGRHPIHEDRFRDLLVAMLNMRLSHLGWQVEPNSVGGSSATGASPGIRDWVLKKRGVEVAVGEALRLSVVHTRSITDHRTKLIGMYNPTGARQLYLVVFCEADNFGAFCQRYQRRFGLEAPLSLPGFGAEAVVFEEEPESGHILHHLLVHLKLPPIKRPQTHGRKKHVRRERPTNRG